MGLTSSRNIAAGGVVLNFCPRSIQVNSQELQKCESLNKVTDITHPKLEKYVGKVTAEVIQGMQGQQIKQGSADIIQTEKGQPENKECLNMASSTFLDLNQGQILGQKLEQEDFGTSLKSSLETFQNCLFKASNAKLKTYLF